MYEIFTVALLLGNLPHFSQDVYARTPNGVCEIKKLPAGRVVVSRSSTPTSYFNPGTNNRLFMPLFRYIQKRKISMTTPVEVRVTPGEMLFHSLPEERDRISPTDSPMSATATSSDAQKVLPGSESAPSPESAVEVRDLPERWVASLGIRGEYSEEKFQKGRQQLLAWLAWQTEYDIVGEAYMTYWNPPFTPWFLKHSEVNIPVRPRTSSRSEETEGQARSKQMERAVFAGGCFWGVEYWMEKLPGVQKVTSGYTGGKSSHPTYEQVKTGETGHYEAVEVAYDPAEIDYETICKRFLEIHDPTQSDGQGPDIGSQYRSAIFYANSAQQETAEELLRQLRSRGLRVVTQLLPLETFWSAEAYHQDYYTRHGTEPYCHIPVKRF